MDLMRSEEMQLLQVIIPTESAHLAVSNLGDLGLIQFKDVSPPPPCPLPPSIRFYPSRRYRRRRIWPLAAPMGRSELLPRRYGYLLAILSKSAAICG
jgi:hypothetical protein